MYPNLKRRHLLRNRHLFGGTRKSARRLPVPIACRRCPRYADLLAQLDLREHDVDQLIDLVEALKRIRFRGGNDDD